MLQKLFATIIFTEMQNQNQINFKKQLMLKLHPQSHSAATTITFILDSLSSERTHIPSLKLCKVFVKSAKSSRVQTSDDHRRRAAGHLRTELQEGRGRRLSEASSGHHLNKSTTHSESNGLSRTQCRRLN